MVEKIYIDYLSAVFPEMPVLAERPSKPIPDTFIMIDNNGTSEENHIWRSTVAFQSYGRSLLDAAELNDRVIEAVKNSTTLNKVASARLNSAYNFTDTATKFYRYQAVFDITHY